MDDESHRVKEFCVLEKISPSQLYEDWKCGVGPDYFYVGSHRRISEEARQRWRRAREEAAKQEQTQLAEAARSTRAAARRLGTSHVLGLSLRPAKNPTAQQVGRETACLEK
jgi:hypothetical protein